MFDKIIAHTSFIGETGYANHSRNFFTALNKLIPVKVRNFPVGKTWNGLNNGEPHNNEWYLTDEHKEMLYKQTCMIDDKRTDFYIYGGNKEIEKGNNLHIILNEVNHYYFYDDYDGPKIAYNVWESTLYPNDFFNRLLKFNQLWVPTKWQKDCIIEQGYLKDKVKVVSEAVDGKIFFPEEIKKNDILKEYKDDRFKFILFGRWDYRKSVNEIIETFLKTFDKKEKVDLVISVDNQFSTDDMKTTERRLSHYGFNDYRIKVKHFPDREEYIRYLKTGHIFVSCARSEGWNLPLCVPEGDKIICNDSIINVEDVKENDVIFTHKNHRKKIIKTMKRYYDGELIKIKVFNDFEKISLTPEHPIYIIKRERFITKKDKFKNIQKLEPEWIEAKNIEKGDLVIKSFVDENKEYNKVIIDLITIDNKLLFNDSKVWYKTDYNSKGDLKRYNRFILIDDLSYVFGWYIAEGRDGESKCCITLNSSEEHVAREWLKQIKNIFDADGSYTKYDTKIQVRVSSTLIARFFSKLCGINSRYKKIPKEILYGDKENLRVLIDEYSRGDGHNNGKNISCSSVSYLLARQLVIGNQRIGRKTSIHKNARDEYIVSWYINSENYKHSDKSWWHFDKDIAQLVKEVSVERYKGYVYNFEVENDNSYLLLNATVHNCEAMACGTPSIYSNWGAQLEFAGGRGLPVNVVGEKAASSARFLDSIPGNYCEPDFDHLSKVMRDAYVNYSSHKEKAIIDSEKIREEFSWENAADKAMVTINKLLLEKENGLKSFKYSNYDAYKKCQIEANHKKIAFITGGDKAYMPFVKMCVQNLFKFSDIDIITYGYNYDVDFECPGNIKKRIDFEQVKQLDGHIDTTYYFAKIQSCIDVINTEDYDYYIWIDADTIPSEYISKIYHFVDKVRNYPLCMRYNDQTIIHWKKIEGQDYQTLYGDEVCEIFDIEPRNNGFLSAMGLFIFNNDSKWVFKEIIEIGEQVRSIEDYKIKKDKLGRNLFIDDNAFSEERIFNMLMWKYGFDDCLPVSWVSKSWKTDSNMNLDKLPTDTNLFQKFIDEDYDAMFLFPDNKKLSFGLLPMAEDDIVFFHAKPKQKDSALTKELLGENTLEKIKLNLGCGDDIKDGYINVDLYNSNAEVQMDIRRLDYEDNIIDEIFSSHALEHFSKRETIPILREWNRVLKSGGQLVMNLPDIEWCMLNWLNTPEKDKWDWSIDSIFGHQMTEGEVHRTGFTKARLEYLLMITGYNNISIVNHQSHGQTCFLVHANKI